MDNKDSSNESLSDDSDLSSNSLVKTLIESSLPDTSSFAELSFEKKMDRLLLSKTPSIYLEVREGEPEFKKDVEEYMNRVTRDRLTQYIPPLVPVYSPKVMKKRTTSHPVLSEMVPPLLSRENYKPIPSVYGNIKFSGSSTQGRLYSVMDDRRNEEMLSRFGLSASNNQQILNGGSTHKCYPSLLPLPKSAKQRRLGKRAGIPGHMIESLSSPSSLTLERTPPSMDVRGQTSIKDGHDKSNRNLLKYSHQVEIETNSLEDSLAVESVKKSLVASQGDEIKKKSLEDSQGIESQKKTLDDSRQIETDDKSLEHSRRLETETMCLENKFQIDLKMKSLQKNYQVKYKRKLVEEDWHVKKKENKSSKRKKTIGFR